MGKTGVNILNYSSSNDFPKSYLMVEAKYITLSDMVSINVREMLKTPIFPKWEKDFYTSKS